MKELTSEVEFERLRHAPDLTVTTVYGMRDGKKVPVKEIYRSVRAGAFYEKHLGGGMAYKRKTEALNG